MQKYKSYINKTNTDGHLLLFIQAIIAHNAIHNKHK